MRFRDYVIGVVIWFAKRAMSIRGQYVVVFQRGRDVRGSVHSGKRGVGVLVSASDPYSYARQLTIVIEEG